MRPPRSETHRQHGLQSMPRLKVMPNEKHLRRSFRHHCEDAPCAVWYARLTRLNRVDGAVQLHRKPVRELQTVPVLPVRLALLSFSGSRPLHIPANANTPKAPPAPPAPARVSTLLDGCRAYAIAVKCDTCSFDESRPGLCAGCAHDKALHWWKTRISPAPAT